MDDGLHLRGRLLVDLLAKCPRFHVPTWLYNVQRFITETKYHRGSHTILQQSRLKKLTHLGWKM